MSEKAEGVGLVGISICGRSFRSWFVVLKWSFLGGHRSETVTTVPKMTHHSRIPAAFGRKMLGVCDESDDSHDESRETTLTVTSY